MLRCPACGRTGGPFLAGPQALVDRHLVRTWLCHCWQRFYTVTGAERTGGPHPVYSGFVLEAEGRSQPVMLRQITRNRTQWQLGPFVLTVPTAPDEERCWPVTVTRQHESPPLFDGSIPPNASVSDIAAQLGTTAKFSPQDAVSLARAFLRITNQDR